MDMWNAHHVTYEKIYLTLLKTVINSTLTRIGRSFDEEFWRCFTKELNDKIRVELRGPLIAEELASSFKDLSTIEVVAIGKRLKAKYHEYKKQSLHLSAISARQSTMNISWQYQICPPSEEPSNLAEELLKKKLHWGVKLWRRKSSIGERPSLWIHVGPTGSYMDPPLHYSNAA
ncbi:hypothetical protein V2J09_007072 [Rumex salicifolius]